MAASGASQVGKNSRTSKETSTFLVSLRRRDCVGALIYQNWGANFLPKSELQGWVPAAVPILSPFSLSHGFIHSDT